MYPQQSAYLNKRMKEKGIFRMRTASLGTKFTQMNGDIIFYGNGLQRVTAHMYQYVE
jgi:hypothetical protein